MPQSVSSSSLFGRLSTSTRSSFMSPKEVRCNVHLLHDSDILANEFPRNQPAQTVLDYVCELKNIQEKDFLGLRYQDHNKHRYWLDLSRSIGHVVKQFRTESLSLHLRFRYYPSEPARIRDLNLRYQLFVQLQRDLLHGRLYCPQTQAADLAACILQAQIGDYDESIHPPNYVSGYKLLLRQTPKLEERIAAIHKTLKGKTSAEAELEFLEKASQLDTYAFDPYTIKDPQDPSNAVYLGASAKGILIYTGTNRAHHIDWAELTKVDYSGRELRISVSDSYTPPTQINTPTGTLKRDENGVGNGHAANGSPISGSSNMDKYVPKKGAQTLKYTCPSGQFAKHLWIHILSQQAFFNEASAQNVKLKFSKPRIPLLSRGSTFRFPSRRVYREIEESLSSGESRMANSMFEKNGGDLLNETTVTTDNDSVFNTSSVSVPVIRYELPRQELRTEQPWLIKPKTVPKSTHFESTAEESSSSSDQEKNNNEKIKLTNLNVSLANTETVKDEESPSTSEVIPPPVYVRTQQITDQNSTSFTVHLVRREASRSQSPIFEFSEHESRAEVLEQEFKENVENGIKLGQPLASSTPRTIKGPAESNGNGSVGNGKIGNGETKTFANGHAQASADDVTITKKPRSLINRITNWSFVMFLMCILTLAVVICVFEKSEGAHNDFIENNKILSEMRYIYYEPARHYVVDQYRKYFGPKL